jgi:enoyl-[acyl-carrier protein] reductase II
MLDGATMAAALALGAEGIQMGTRMVSSLESPVHENWKRAVVAAAETDTVFLNRRHGPGLRALRTKRSEELEHAAHNVMSEFGDRANVMKLYFGGDLEAALALSGQVAGRIDAVRPVAEVIRETAGDCLALLERLAARYPRAEAHA